MSVAFATLREALVKRPAGQTVLSGHGVEWTAGAMLDEADALAERLAGTRVLALLADNSPAWALADIAALQAGIPVLPLPLFFTSSQLAHALDQAGVDRIATDQVERVRTGTRFEIEDLRWPDLDVSPGRAGAPAGRYCQNLLYFGKYRRAERRLPECRGTDGDGTVGGGRLVGACR